MQKIKLPAMLVALTAIAVTGCAKLPAFHSIGYKNVARSRVSPPELDAFLDAASDAARDLALADSISDWQARYDKVKDLGGKLPDSLDLAVQKQCDGIREQMEIGKLALTMKRVDAKSGLKQCKLVSAEITKHIEKARAFGSSQA